MKFRTDELTGQDLNEAVAIVVGPGWRRARLADGLLVVGIGDEMDDPVVGGTPFEPSTVWAVAGPIIEREYIETEPVATPEGKLLWRARKHDARGVFLPGHTDASLLVAAMRCFVFRALGPEVDL